MSTLRRARDALQTAVRAVLPGGAKASLARALTSAPVTASLSLVADRIPCGECTFDTRVDAIAPRTRAEMLWGLYESAERRLVGAYLRPGLDLVELGASLGVVSSHLARRLGQGHKLVCVEANPQLLGAIRTNVRRNAPDAHVEIVGAAIAYGAEHVRIELGADTTTGRLAGVGAASGIEVAATTLSRLLEEHAVGEYVLVMDIEGAEAAILREDPGALTRCHQIIAELHATTYGDSALRQDDLAREIEGLGFRRTHQDGFVYLFDRP
jgi:FkbM family methyltransferase